MSLGYLRVVTAGEGPATPTVETADESGDEGEGDESPLGKSFNVTLEDGSVQEAWDGTALLKSMGTELAALRTSTAELNTELEAV